MVSAFAAGLFFYDMNQFEIGNSADPYAGYLKGGYILQKMSLCTLFHQMRSQHDCCDLIWCSLKNVAYGPPYRLGLLENG